MAGESFIYFTDDYAQYYKNLHGENSKGAKDLRDTVEQVNNQFNLFSSQINDWSGEAKDSYQELYEMVCNQLKDIKKNIETALEPACEALDDLKDKLQDFKDADKETLEAKNAWENENHKNVPE